MSEEKVLDFAAKRWNEGPDDPAAHKLFDALRAALRDWDESKIRHVIIVAAESLEGTAASAMWLQAGDYNKHAQVGLLLRAVHGGLDAE